MPHLLEIGIMEAVTIVVAIFSVVLFFKIWGMTDDVKEIKKALLDKLKEEKQQEDKKE